MAENTPQISTMKEALIAELLSDLNATINKTDEVIQAAAKVESEVTISTKALIVAGEKYKATVKTFTEETKTAFSGYIEEKMVSSVSLTISELKKDDNRLILDKIDKLNNGQKVMFIFLTISLLINFIVVYVLLSP